MTPKEEQAVAANPMTALLEHSSLFSTDGGEEWVLTYAELDLRPDMRVHVLAITRLIGMECLALAVRPVLNVIVAISTLFMSFRALGRPAHILLSSSIPPLLAQDLRSSLKLSTTMSIA
jgi:hypothetical protein